MTCAFLEAKCMPAKVDSTFDGVVVDGGAERLVATDVCPVIVCFSVDGDLCADLVAVARFGGGGVGC